MRVLSFSETGCVRKNNEDAYLVLAEEGLFAVADGMGGHRSGEVAARIALGELARLAPELKDVEDENLDAWLINALSCANKEVFQSAAEDPNNEGMGTTLTALLIRGKTAVVAHVGDSRAYLWRDEALLPLTVDHSLVEELVRLGQISEEEAERHPQRHVLMRAIGAEKETKIDCRRFDVQPNDVFLLCTDGLTNVISEDEFKTEFKNDKTWEERFEQLKELTLKRGAPDNFTAVCCIMESSYDG